MNIAILLPDCNLACDEMEEGVKREVCGGIRMVASDHIDPPVLDLEIGKYVDIRDIESQDPAFGGRIPLLNVRDIDIFIQHFLNGSQQSGGQFRAHAHRILSKIFLIAIPFGRIGLP